MPQVIILADGKSKPEHMDNRHFMLFDNVPLIERTILQMNEIGPVRVIAPESYDERLAHLPVSVVRGDNKEDLYFGADMIRKGLKNVGSHGNLLVFGDVWFSDLAIEIIKNHNWDDWAVFGRSEASKFNGSPWAEYFAISVHGRRRNQAFTALDNCANHHLNGYWGRCSPWEWYMEMEDMTYWIPDTKKIEVGPHWVEIHDRTDDFDYIDDYERWHGKS